MESTTGIDPPARGLANNSPKGSAENIDLTHYKYKGVPVNKYNGVPIKNFGTPKK